MYSMYYWKERAERKIKQNRQWQNRTAAYWAVSIKANMNQILVSDMFFPSNFTPGLFFFNVNSFDFVSWVYNIYEAAPVE